MLTFCLGVICYMYFILSDFLKIHSKCITVNKHYLSTEKYIRIFLIVTEQPVQLQHVLVKHSTTQNDLISEFR